MCTQFLKLTLFVTDTDMRTQIYARMRFFWRTSALRIAATIGLVNLAIKEIKENGEDEPNHSVFRHFEERKKNGGN